VLDVTAAKLERYMDLLAVRQRLVADNLANIDTPGYRTRDIDFAAEFARVNAQESPTQITELNGLLTKPDGNNVSLDRENRLLAENSMRFQAASLLLRGHMRILQTSIKEGA
jgi:flagellar basal-body rod protein FlgB